MPTIIHQIDAGRRTDSTVGGWEADAFYTAGQTTTDVAKDTTGVTNPPTAACFLNVAYANNTGGTVGWTIGGHAANASVQVEIYCSSDAANANWIANVDIMGSRAETGVNASTKTGGTASKAFRLVYTATANSSGQIIILFTSTSAYPLIDAIRTTEGIDTTAPTGAITAPTASQVLTGTVAFTASATDANGVASVQFYIDGVAVQSPDTVAPYSINVDTTTLTNASHTCYAIITDNAGNPFQTPTITFSVNNAASVVTYTVRLAWTPSSGSPTAYEIRRATDNGFTTGVVDIPVAGGGTAYYDDATLTAGTYFWKIRAKNINNVFSAYSIVRTLTIP